MGVKFGVIVADPPWEWPPPGADGFRFHGRTSPKKHGWYWGGTLSVDRLAAAKLPAADDCVLLLWCPASMLETALLVVVAWGFKYKTNIVWAKSTKEGKVRHTGVGYHTRMVHENLILATKGKGHRKYHSAVIPSVVVAPATMDGGGKPDAIYDMVEQQYHGPYLELFARRRRKGWHSYGNELEGGSDISIPEWE